MSTPRLIPDRFSFVVIFSSFSPERGWGAGSSLAPQQLENLGFVKTRPRLRAFEYSEMFVTLMLCFVSRSFSAISGSILFCAPRVVVCVKCCLCS